MPFAGVGPATPYWPDKPPPVGAHDLLFPNNGPTWQTEPWVARPMHLRRQPTNPQIIEIEAGGAKPPGNGDWVTFIDLGEPVHQAHEHADATVRNDESWRDAASVTMPVIAGHRYFITGSAQVDWTIVTAPTNRPYVSIRYSLDGHHVARERFPSSRLTADFSASIVWTATTTGNAVMKIQWGADEAGLNCHLVKSSIDVAEQR